MKSKLKIDYKLKKIPLADAVSVTTGFPFKSTNYSTEKNDVLLLRGDNIVQGKLRWDDAKRWTKEELEFFSKYLLLEGDIVLAMDRPWIEAGLKYASITKNDLPCLLVQRVSCLRVKKNYDQKFLKYVIGSNAFTDYILSIQTGSTIPHISTKQINEFEFEFPDLKTQSRIGCFLSTLDLKIHNLQNQNKILEQIIQSIFKSWFIDFDGVTEFEDSELGPIPKGWQVGTFADVIEEIESGKRPKGGINSLDTEIPSIGAENIIGLGRYDYSKTKYVSLKFFNEMKTGRIKDNDVLLYKDGASLGRKSLFRNDFPFKQCCINEHVFILRPNKKISSTFLFFWLDQNWMEENVRNLNSNSAQPGINKPGVLSLPILIPEIYTINSFQRLVEPIIIKIFKNSILIQSLTKTRDVLLPKLMSGEIRV